MNPNAMLPSKDGWVYVGLMTANLFVLFAAVTGIVTWFRWVF